MDFRFHYDPVALQPVSVEAGASAIKAGKRIMANVAKPGEYIIVMLGLSSGSEQSVCTNGEIARVIMRTTSTETVPWGLKFGKAAVSATDGTEMPVRTTPYQGRNAGSGNPVVTPAVPQKTTPETEDESSTPTSSTKTSEVAGLSVQPPVILEDAEAKVKASLAETRRIREEISKPNAVSAGQITPEHVAATQVAADKTDTVTEASSAPERVGDKVKPVNNTGDTDKRDGAQAASATPKIENDRPGQTEEQSSVSRTTKPSQHDDTAVGLWLVAGIGVLAILGLLVLLLLRK